MLIKTFSGFASSASGFFLVFNYLDGLNHQSNNLIMLAISIPLIGVGIYLIYKGGRTDYSQKIGEASTTRNGQESIIERNNKIVTDWIQSTENADKLKTLEIDAAAEDDDKK